MERWEIEREAAIEEVINERDRLRAEVERLRGLLTETAAFLDRARADRASNYCDVCGVKRYLHESPPPHGCGEAARKAGV